MKKMYEVSRKYINHKGFEYILDVIDKRESDHTIVIVAEDLNTGKKIVREYEANETIAINLALNEFSEIVG